MVLSLKRGEAVSGLRRKKMVFAFFLSSLKIVKIQGEPRERERERVRERERERERERLKIIY